MKKLIFLLLLLASTVVQAQSLNAEAKYLQKTEATQEAYQKIENFAKNKWGRDYKMVVYEVNKQSKALVEILLIITQNDDGSPEHQVLGDALRKWKGDYHMVLFEFERQMVSYYEIL